MLSQPPQPSCMLCLARIASNIVLGRRTLISGNLLLLTHRASTQAFQMTHADIGRLPSWRSCWSLQRCSTCFISWRAKILPRTTSIPHHRYCVGPREMAGFLMGQPSSIVSALCWHISTKAPPWVCCPCPQKLSAERCRLQIHIIK